MKSLKLLVLTAAVLLLVAADGHARPRLFGRRCQPCQAAQPTAYRPAAQPVSQPAPAVVMPTSGLLTLPGRVVQAVGGCINGVCPTR